MRSVTRLLALLLLPLLAAGTVRAAERIVVDPAWVNVRGGVFEVNARTNFPADDTLRTALLDGATINFDLQAVVEKQRRYWLDATLVDVILRRELTWNAVSQLFVLKEADRGEQRTFATLEEAVAAAGVIEDWPVVVEPQLDPDAIYQIRVRAGYRRGRLPGSLSKVMFWSDGWSRSSKWNEWILPR